METVAAALRRGADRLARVADSPRHEARMLLAHALGVGQADLLRDGQREIDCGVFDRLLDRRVSREPMAMILGHQGFWTLDLLVSPATLVPRADTETVVEAVLRDVARPAARILDLGTGTGCLLLALLVEFPAAFGIGVDRVPAAAALARANALRNGLIGRSDFVVADWTDPLRGWFDVIVSNPPYIPSGDIPGLMPDVALYEPASALDGGADGYDAYRTIILRLGSLLAPDGLAVLELGAGQANYVGELAGAAGFTARFHRDLAGIERAISLRPGES
jgi:release factor glutamine methyltransferase